MVDFKKFWEKTFKKFREQMGDELPFKSILELESEVVEGFCNLIKPGDRLLDFGCGIGRNSLAFAQRGFKVDICDISDEAIKFCMEYSKKMDIGLNPKEYDENRVNEKANTYNAIIAWAVLDHVTFDVSISLSAEFHRLLKPDGLLLVTFDPINEGECDKDECFDILNDGTIIFNSGDKDGFLFRKYTNREINELFLLGWEPLAFFGADPEKPRLALFRCKKA